MEVVLIKVIFGLLGLLLGLVLGSFTLVLADRSLKKSSFWGRSYCMHCKSSLHWYDLFPVFSYVFLKGRCRYCKKKIGLSYPAVEIATGLLIGFLFFETFKDYQLLNISFETLISFPFLNFLFELILKVFFIVVLVAVFVTDYRKMLIPDRIILPSILIGLISLLSLTICKISYLYFYLSASAVGKYLLPPHSDYFQRHVLMAAQPFFGSLIMAVLIGGFFWGLIIITKGKGMGGGDVKLGAFMGLMLGFPLSLLAIILSFITGALFSVVLLISGKKHFGQSIAFGPFLVLGSLIALFWGSRIISWYLNLRPIIN